MFTCLNCKKEIKNNLFKYTIDGDVMCMECIEHKKENNELKTCYECGSIITNPGSTSIHYICGNYYCDSCCVYCSDCDKLVPISETYATSIGRVICVDCYDDNYFTCDCCSEIYSTDDMNCLFSECYCGYCFEDKTAEYGIHTYNYKPCATFYNMKDEAELRENNLHVGIELEIQGVDMVEFCKDIVNKYDYNSGLFYLKIDGSLNENGIEIVSNPMTFNFIKNSGDWKYCFELMKEYNMNDTVGCGLHFHLDRNYLNKDMIAVIDYIVNNYDEYFEKYCGRKYDYYCRKMSKRIDEWGKAKDFTRYSSVNLTNSNTVELRFCKSTCNYETFIERVKLIFAIVEFAKKYTIKDINFNKTIFNSVFNKHFKNIFENKPIPYLD